MALFVPSLAFYLILIQFIFVRITLSQEGHYPKAGSDLNTFVSRPDLRPPTFNITVHNSDCVTPGYWFLAPYTSLDTERSRIFRPAQIGPHIFDNQGNLIWSGATFDERAVCDFKVGVWNDSLHLTYILLKDLPDKEDPSAVGLILDSSYAIRDKVRSYGNLGMHEFNIINQGRSAIVTTGKFREYTSLSNETFLAYGCIFQEINTQTGELIFAWDSLDYVQPTEAERFHKSLDDNHWDYLYVNSYLRLNGYTNKIRLTSHLNSVEKNAEGDFLVSGRHVNCIYKISGRDGSIIWRLGGTNSSFILEGFNFSGQHDARIMAENSTTTIISFLNNAADQINSTATYSSAMIVAIHNSTSPMTATIIKQFDRPDEKLTELRGNVQVLPNSNIFVGWSDNGYISEFTPDGRCVFEAQFASMRFATYRAFKFNFTASPTEPPTLKCYVYGALTAPDAVLTVCWVSWNGATEVSSWNFYGPDESSSSGVTLLGSARKTGFETMFTAAGYPSWVVAEAVAANGSILGHSEKTETISTQGISFAGDTQGIGDGTLDTKTLPADLGDGIHYSDSIVNSVGRARMSFSNWDNDIGIIAAYVALSVGVYYIGFSVLRFGIIGLKRYQQEYLTGD